MTENGPSLTELGIEEKAWKLDKLRNRKSRENHLDSVPANNFPDEERLQWVTGRLLDLGLPVDNIQSLSRKRNKYGSENVLGSWGVGKENKGEFSVYELLDKQVPEKQLGTLAHEGAHANTPFDPENDRLFGSKEKREEAAQLARNAAKQTLETRKFYNGYHKYLYERLQEGKIDDADFAEETWAIMTELALTNRKKLEQVQDAQHAALERRRKQGEDVMDSVQLLTPESDDPEIIAAGVDGALLALIEEVDDYQGLTEHVGILKEKFYPDESLQIAQKR